MKYKKKTQKAWKHSLLITFLLCMVLLFLSLVSYEPLQNNWNQESSVSEEVIAYEPLVKKYAEKYGIADKTHVLLAMMMQESGGRGNDPMQASESFCGSRGCIDDPKVSIKQGVYYFSKTLEEADGDVELAVQAYNFGRGFIDYAVNRTGTFTQETAIAFSQKMYNEDPEKEKYRCLREEAKKLEACYGDIYYVESVMEYKKGLATD
ncbi:lysozyme family protein [Virgibacillus sp. SK37]|uniref:lysozyme family protein n=1 Tax=Virgibacillus sp. SK37 TaxID=403957 RepID=UPI0004D1DA8E|nr:lysozyme family protein [Virgibacillus sp. SK37]AIF44752.1 hypothetical protein X953_17795 [Virgibacillus sp. SK37]